MEPQPKLTKHLNQGNAGLELVLAALLVGLFGWWLDTKFGTRPFFFVGLTLFGFIGSALSKYYRFKAEIAKLRAETDQLQAKASSGRSEA